MQAYLWIADYQLPQQSRYPSLGVEFRCTASTLLLVVFRIPEYKCHVSRVPRELCRMHSSSNRPPGIDLSVRPPQCAGYLGTGATPTPRPHLRGAHWGWASALVVSRFLGITGLIPCGAPTKHMQYARCARVCKRCIEVRGILAWKAVNLQ